MSAGTITLHPEHEIDPVVTTVRLRVLKDVRTNLHRMQIARDGVLRPMPLLDGAIDRLEELLAMHLPAGPGGLV